MTDTRRLMPIFITVFFVFMGTGMMFPLLAQIADQQGGGSAEAGFLLAAFAVARLSVNLPAGAAADRFGRRIVMVVGLIILATGSQIAWITTDITLLGLAVLLQGAGSSIFSTAALACVADFSTEHNRGTMMSRYQTAVLIGVSIGPVTGGILSGRVMLAAPFALQEVLVLCGAILIARLKLPPAPIQATSDKATAGKPGRFTGLFSDPVILTLMTLFFTLYMTRTAANWQVVPLMARTRYGYSPELIGVLLTAGACGNLVIQGVIGRLIDNFGAAGSILVGALGVGAVLTWLGTIDSEFAMWASTLLLGLFSGMLAPALNAFVINHVKTGYGATLGALRTAGDAGLVLGPLLLGQVLAGVGISMEHGLLLAGGLMFVATLGFIIFGTRRS